MTQACDVLVLGGGTGGYVAAIRAAQLGLSVVVVERDKVGGTCLHRGCIPSKAMLHSASMFANFRSASSYGIHVEQVTLDFEGVANHRDQVVGQMYKGVKQLLHKYRIPIVQGQGRLMGPSIFSPTAGAISVERADGTSEVFTPRYVILATGSRPRVVPGIEVDGHFVVTSDHIIESRAIPSSILIVGGGAIGVEWASMYADFGIEVTLVETEERILSREDEHISRGMSQTLKDRGVRLFTGARVQSLQRTGDSSGCVTVVHGDETISIETARVLVSAGRVPNTEDIGLDATQVVCLRGTIQVDGRMRTSEKNIFAIGDIVAGYQLAHVAARQGIIAAETIAGLRPTPLDERFVPRCIYSRPELGCVGLTETDARDHGFTVKTGVFPLRALGKAHIEGDVDGFVKVVADATTDDLLGVHIMGPRATDLVSEAGLALLLQASVWELGLAVRPHPSFAEALTEAALASDQLALHI